MLLNSLWCVEKSVKKQIKFIECVYHKRRPRKVPNSEHVQLVQIYLIFAGPVTNAFLLKGFSHDLIEKF